MNADYCLLRNEKTGIAPSPTPAPRFGLKTLALSLMLAFGANVYALPLGGVVTAGGAAISGTAAALTINQATQNAIINWQSFGIGAGEVVRFIQPNASAVALNRVLGADPSAILGSLSANGKVFLVNPNGILFGQGATVNVAGLVASSLAISDADFLAGHYLFSGAGQGSVLNQCTLNADGGFVALLGANVGNTGTITARLGSVALAAGAAITLDVAGDGLLNVVVNQGAVHALVENGGLIQADGGQVFLSARAAGGLLQGGVNNTGVIQAQTIENHQGTIKLLGDMATGTVNVAGTLDTGAPQGGNGGFIETSAAHVKVADTASISTLAPAGITGTWLIDPTDYTVAVAGGDITGLMLAHNLLASNITISSNNGLLGTAGDIHVNTDIHWAGATTLTLNAVHDLLVDAGITADTAGAKLILQAGHDIGLTAPLGVVAAGASISISAGNDARLGGPITGTAANTSITLHADRNVITSAPILLVAADSALTVSAGLDLRIGGAITGVAANSAILLSAGQDLSSTAAIAVSAADSMIRLSAGRDVNTSATAAIAAGAATSGIELNAGHNINVNAAISAGAAGSAVNLLAGMDGSGPGVVGGTVKLLGAVASPHTTIRFNPVSYANTSLEIANYPALADAKAWVFVQGNNKVYDALSSASLIFKGTPGDGGLVSLLPGTASFASKDAAIGKSISFDGYRLGGADAGKFALFAGSGTTAADITPRPLGVSAVGTNKVYDGSTTTTVVLADQRLRGDVLALSWSAANFLDKNVGDGKALTVSGVSVSGADAGNYSFSPSLTGTANITPAALTITAANATKSYGQSPILSGFSQVGLVNGESIGSVSESSPGTGVSTGQAGSTYGITPGNAAGGTFTSANYRISYIDGALNVIPAGLLITAADASKYYGQSMILTAFTAKGLVNGETVGAFTEKSLGTPAAAAVGNYAITLSKAGGGSFNPANYSIVYVNGTLSVLPPIKIPPVERESSAASATSLMPAVLLASPAALDALPLETPGVPKI